MGFGCPICSERLEKLPAESQNRGNGGSSGELNIAATPCGHIFHAYCIQKWLSGNLASSKQCPCCRKDVPRLRCLSLFPTSYDESLLDDSLSQSDGHPPPICNHAEVIASLKNRVARLESDIKEKDQLYDLLSNDHTTLIENFRTEKLSCDTWMMRAKEYESYRDLAHQLEDRASKAENRLKTFASIESMLKGVENHVNDEIRNFPPNMESIRSLLEMKLVMSAELKRISHKYEEMKKNYEEVRQEKIRIKVQLQKKTQELKELQHVYEISRINGRVRSPAPSTVGSMDTGNTPKAFRTKLRLDPLATNLPTTASSHDPPELDSDVDLFPTGRKKKAKPKTDDSCSKTKAVIKRTKLTSDVCKTSKTNKSPKLDSIINISDSDSDEDDKGDTDDLKIRGNFPGAPVPITADGMSKLQHKADRRILGISSKTPKKKFIFKKSGQ